MPDPINENSQSSPPKSFLARRWKLVLNLIIVAALIALIVGIRGQLVDTVSNLAKVNAWILMALIPLFFASFDLQARLYRDLFGVLGDKIGYWLAYKLSLEINFINQVLPSGGVSGISYFGVRLRKQGVSATRAVLVQIMRLFLTWISFELLLIAGLIILSSHQHVNNLTILFASVVSTLVIVGTFLFAFVVGSRPRINATADALARWINRLLAKLPIIKTKRRINEVRFRRILDDMHDNYKAFQSRLRRLVPGFWLAFLINVVEVLTLYVVFLAFGQPVNLGAIIVAYAVANFAGLISVLPAGAGIYEALMTAVLVIAGVPASISLPAVIMYRIISTIFKLPPGYYLYNYGLR